MSPTEQPNTYEGSGKRKEIESIIQSIRTIGNQRQKEPDWEQKLDEEIEHLNGIITPQIDRRVGDVRQVVYDRGNFSLIISITHDICNVVVDGLESLDNAPNVITPPKKIVTKPEFIDEHAPDKSEGETQPVSNKVKEAMSAPTELVPAEVKQRAEEIAKSLKEKGEDVTRKNIESRLTEKPTRKEMHEIMQHLRDRGLAPQIGLTDDQNRKRADLARRTDAMHAKQKKIREAGGTPFLEKGMKVSAMRGGHEIDAEQRERRQGKLSRKGPFDDEKGYGNGNGHGHREGHPSVRREPSYPQPQFKPKPPVTDLISGKKKSAEKESDPASGAQPTTDDTTIYTDPDIRNVGDDTQRTTLPNGVNQIAEGFPQVPIIGEREVTYPEDEPLVFEGDFTGETLEDYMGEFLANYHDAIDYLTESDASTFNLEDLSKALDIDDAESQLIIDALVEKGLVHKLSENVYQNKVEKKNDQTPQHEKGDDSRQNPDYEEYKKRRGESSNTPPENNSPKKPESDPVPEKNQPTEAGGTFENEIDNIDNRLEELENLVKGLDPQLLKNETLDQIRDTFASLLSSPLVGNPIVALLIQKKDIDTYFNAVKTLKREVISDQQAKDRPSFASHTQAVERAINEVANNTKLPDSLIALLERAYLQERRKFLMGTPEESYFGPSQMVRDEITKHTKHQTSVDPEKPEPGENPEETQLTAEQVAAKQREEVLKSLTLENRTRVEDIENILLSNVGRGKFDANINVLQAELPGVDEALLTDALGILEAAGVIKNGKTYFNYYSSSFPKEPSNTKPPKIPKIIDRPEERLEIIEEEKEIEEKPTTTDVEVWGGLSNEEWSEIKNTPDYISARSKTDAARDALINEIVSDAQNKKLRGLRERLGLISPKKTAGKALDDITNSSKFSDAITEYRLRVEDLITVIRASIYARENSNKDRERISELQKNIRSQEDAALIKMTPENTRKLVEGFSNKKFLTKSKIAAVVIAALGGGGYYTYKKYTDADDTREAITQKQESPFNLSPEAKLRLQQWPIKSEYNALYDAVRDGLTYAGFLGEDLSGPQIQYVVNKVIDDIIKKKTLYELNQAGIPNGEINDLKEGDTVNLHELFLKNSGEMAKIISEIQSGNGLLRNVNGDQIINEDGKVYKLEQ